MLSSPGSRVILIGTGKHPPEARLPTISSIGPSLTDLAIILRDTAGISAKNVTLLLDPSGPAELGEALDRTAKTATDVLLIYVAGHGLAGDDGDLYLATAMTDDPVEGPGVPGPAVPDAAEDHPAFLRADTCRHLGLLFRWPRRVPGGTTAVRRGS